MPRLSHNRCLLAAFVGWTLLQSPEVFGNETSLPPNESLVGGGGIGGLKIAGKSAGDATTKQSAPADAPGGQALRVDVKKRSASDYEIQFTLPLSAAINNGDLVWAGVWARMLDTQDESGQGVLGMVVEQKAEPYNKIIQRRISVGKTWQQLAAPVRVTKDYAAGTMQFSLRVGGAVQTLELARPQVVRFTQPAGVNINDLPQTRLTYMGREPDAKWRAAADERIERIRKAPLTVRVTDAAGKPVPNATVAVAMQRHAFPFGSCYNVSEINGANADTPDGRQYRKVFADLFNVGVDEYAMKWGPWENAAKRQQAMDALKWMDDHRIRVRGHTLVWPAFKRNPESLKALEADPAGLAKKIEARITDTARALAGRVTEWDVINEPYANNDFMKLLGEKSMAHWFKLARAADPNAVLYLNETSVPTAPPGDQHYDVLFNQVKMIQAEGGPIGGVGMQAHFGSNLTGITDLQTIYDRFATLGVPLQITEFDINVTDAELQADYLRDFMTITFAHPNSSGILIWGFWQGQHWRPDAALYTKDWKLRPVGRAWIDLVKKKWWTTATLTTATDGSGSVRGFLGDYQITVTANGKTKTIDAALPKHGKAIDVSLD